MACNVCGSNVKNPDTSRHISSKKHQVALKKQNSSQIKKRYFFKIPVLGGGAVGKTSFVNSIFPSFIHGCTLGMMPDSFKSHKYQLQKRKEDVDVTIQVWDSTRCDSIPNHLRITMLGAHTALLLFDVTRFSTFKSVMKWIAYLYAYRQQIIPFILVGSKIDLRESFPDAATPEFGTQYSLALSYLTGYYIPYIEVSNFPINELKSENQKLLSNIATQLLYMYEKTDLLDDEGNYYSLKQDAFIICYKLARCEKPEILLNFVFDEEIDLATRILAIKRLLQIDPTNLSQLQDLATRSDFGFMQLYSEQDQERLYEQVIGGDTPLDRVVALDLLKDQEKLKIIAVGHPNMLIKLFARSKIKGEEYFNFLRETYEISETKDILIHNTNEGNLLRDIILTDNETVYIKNLALNRITSMKDLQILRLIADPDFQPAIVKRMSEISSVKVL